MNTVNWRRNLPGALRAFGKWIGSADPTAASGLLWPISGGDDLNAPPAANLGMTKSAKLTTLVSFTGDDGLTPNGGLIFDAAGNLLGTTYSGGADDFGTAFEVAKTKHGYADAPTTLVTFTSSSGPNPGGGLVADAAGDLFGSTSGEGDRTNGTVFEIAETKHGYAGAATTLVRFTGTDGEDPSGSLIIDSAGNLFGVTERGGADGDGAVFEIAKTKQGYANAPAVLVSFASGNGEEPTGGLVADAAGDLFGTTYGGGADSFGTVFEIAKTKTGYAGAPTTLVSFTGPDGAFPLGGLAIDAKGDLFGTTFDGGDNYDGAVFEIVKTKTGYADAPTVLVSFNQTDGGQPSGSLLVDAAGNLFGSAGGGVNGDGIVFKIAKTKGGYASAPTILASFDLSNGAYPTGALIADAAGNLFGTTSYGGAADDGTVFEITNSGFVTAGAPVGSAEVGHTQGLTAAFVQAMAGRPSRGAGETSRLALDLRGERPTLLARP